MKKILLVIVVVLALGTKANAQMKVNKLGYINSLELLSLMPETKVADEKLEKYGKDLEGLYDQMIKEGQTKAAEFEKISRDSTDNDVTLQFKYEELMSLQKKVGDFEASINEKIGAKREEFYAPIVEKANNAIKAVAKENGFTYIFDASAGSIVYADETDDVLPLVKKKLAIQ